MSNANKKPVEQDWRFAELIARTWMEPGLADRYAADPCTVLAEFGLTIARAEDAPSLEPYCGSELIIEDLEHARGFRLTMTGGSCRGEGDEDDEKKDAERPVVARIDPAEAAEPCA